MDKGSSFRFTPPRVLVLGFAGAILIGSILMALPVSWAPGKSISYFDALFTATSAVCVTGLVVVDTGSTFSAFGITVLALLIQIGGLGLMTSGTLIALALGRKIGLRGRILMQEERNQLSLAGMVRVTRNLLAFSFLTEAIGALILGLHWSNQVGWLRGLAFGVFHSISAFNNAGFDLFGEFRSLTGYVDDILVNMVITALLVIGGLGFGVIADLVRNRGRWFKLALHTRLVLIISGALFISSMAVFYLLERNNPGTLQGLSPQGRFLATWFQALTPRTAGFNTVDTGALLPPTLFWMSIMMFIGASPGSTGGGIKTTTFGMLVITVWAIISGKEDAQVFGRRFMKTQMYKALAITMISLSVVTLVTMTLAVTEKVAFEKLLFETFSAFGTVGLSAGVTTGLSGFGRVLIILTMFIGRVGPLTLGYALAKRKKKAGLKYPEESIMVG